MQRLLIGSSVSAAWLARRAQMGQPRNVSQYVRRLRLQKVDSKRDFQNGAANQRKGAVMTSMALR